MWGCRLFALTIAISGAAIQLAAQAPGRNANSKPGSWTVPHLPDGHPDLEGYWTNNTATPLQRPDGAAEFLTDEQIKDLEARAGQTLPNRNNPFPTLFPGDARYVMRRTSIITDPKDGRIPPLTPAGKQKFETLQEEHKRRFHAGPEDMTLLERCITWISSGPPMLPTFYNNNYQIVQTRDHVVILTEMVHDARIVPTDARPHRNIPQYMGEERGHWEGDTLVVETTHFNGQRGWFGASGQFDGDDLKRPDENMRVSERFTRTGPNTLLYQFTVEDPVIYTKPWSGEIEMRAFEGPILEYACQEANQSLELILGGARADERAATKAAQKKSQ
jgi:hypothetical protein